MPETTSAYNESAQTYEQRWAAYLQHTHDVFLKHLNFSESGQILDLSCGTGLLAHEFLKQGHTFDQLVLNDPAEEMLNIAKNRLPAQPHISFSSAPAHDLPFDDNSFTRIFSLNAFHNYPHQETVISELRRVLEPDGHFHLQDWNRSGFFRPVNSLIHWWASEHIDTRSATECKRMLKDQNFLIEQEEVWRYRYWKFFFIKASLKRDS